MSISIQDKHILYIDICFSNGLYSYQQDKVGKRIMKYMLIIVFVIVSSVAVADNLAKDKKTLENMQLELDQKKEALDKSKEAVKAMEKKLECKYNLLQAYNQCEEKHQKGTDEYGKCMTKAKEANSDCSDNS